MPLRLEDLASIWMEQQKDYPLTPQGNAAAAAVRACAKEILELAETGQWKSRSVVEEMSNVESF